jgi:hypothetical protein
MLKSMTCDFIDAFPRQLWCDLRFSNHSAGILVIAQPDELRMAKMIPTRPFEELNFRSDLRLHPHAFPHLLGG